ncbi:MAG: hypothetical protein Q7R84_02555 [bacterium]|nr:hypothetical protein [bacterium]
MRELKRFYPITIVSVLLTMLWTLLAPMACTNNNKVEAVVTWNPIALEILDQVPQAKVIFDSSKIPNEILDITFLRTDVVEKNPELAMALAGAWYETLALMQGDGPEATKALTAMAEKSGTSLDSYKRQLKTTYMYWKPADAAGFARSKKLIEVMDLVRKFSFENGLWQDAKSVDTVGIQFPDGTVLGDKGNVKLRFTDKYMEVPTWRTVTGPKKHFVIANSIYVGWMALFYAAESSGILKKWGDRFNAEIEVVQMDYMPSVEAYVAGKVDGVLMTNMEALNMAAVAGVDTTGVIIGDYSNGNDMVIVTGNFKQVSDLKGKNVYIVELSVSDYLLTRGLQTEGRGVTRKDLKLMNTSDADIGPLFISANSR